MLPWHFFFCASCFHAIYVPHLGVVFSLRKVIIPHDFLSIFLLGIYFSFEGKNIPEDDTVGNDHHCGFVRLRKVKDPPGVLYRSQRIQVKVRDINTLEMFPFDKQILELTLRLPGSDDPSR